MHLHVPAVYLELGLGLEPSYLLNRKEEHKHCARLLFMCSAEVSLTGLE